MSRLTTPLAVSADYADALLTARRAKSWAFLLILLFLIVQITVFFLVRFDQIKIGDSASGSTVSVEKSMDSPSTQAVTKASVRLDDAASYATGFIVFAATGLAILLTVVLLVITLIMLQGRLIGVSHVVSALIWSIVLIVLLLPWQRFYSGGPVSASSLSVSSREDFRLPGVLYTWPELAHDAKFPNDPLGYAILKYVRFVAAPLFALIILFMIQAKSGRGIKYALGEAEVHIDLPTETDRL